MTDETPDVVSRARAALDGITPGPWVRDNPDDRFSEHDDVFSGDVWSRRVAGLISRRADATFIAAAPDLVRDLHREVERLTAERDEARAEVERLEADLDGAAYRAGRNQGELAEAQEWAAWFAAKADIWHHLSLAAGGPVGTHGDAVDAIASLRRETDQAGQAELRVRLLHSPVDCRCGCGNTICTECPSENHPCPTIRAFDGEA